MSKASRDEPFTQVYLFVKFINQWMPPVKAASIFLQTVSRSAAFPLSTHNPKTQDYEAKEKEILVSREDVATTPAATTDLRQQV